MYVPGISPAPAIIERAFKPSNSILRFAASSSAETNFADALIRFSNGFSASNTPSINTGATPFSDHKMPFSSKKRSNSFSL